MITLVRQGSSILWIELSNGERIYAGNARFNLWLKRAKRGKVKRRYADSNYNYLQVIWRK